MHFPCVPTLENAALIKIAAKLWNEDDIRYLLSTFRFQSSDPASKQKEWQKIEHKVSEKIPNLQMAESVNSRLREFVEPLGLQILKWLLDHIVNPNLGLHLPTTFYWTIEGTIDTRKTSEQLVKDESIDVFKRYKLACLNCLEKDITILWSRLPETLKNTLCNEENDIFYEDPIVIHWSDVLNRVTSTRLPGAEGIQEGDSVCHSEAFKYAALESLNAVATEYFLHKLESKERRKYLRKTVPALMHKVRHNIFRNSTRCIEEYSKILLILLSQMETENQMEVAEKFPFEVLFCYLEWPLQNLFMEIANQLWNFLDEENYFLAFMTICNKAKSGRKDHNYKELLGKFWEHCPRRFKLHMINICGNDFSLPRLYGSDARSCIRLSLNHVPVFLKREVLETEELCEKIIRRGSWDTLAVLVEDCLHSKEAIIKFKTEMGTRLILLQKKGQLDERVTERFFQLLEELIANFEGRNLQN